MTSTGQNPGALAFRGSLLEMTEGPVGLMPPAPLLVFAPVWHWPVTSSDQMGTMAGYHRLGDFLICAIFPSDQGGRGQGAFRWQACHPAKCGAHHPMPAEGRRPQACPESPLRSH